MGDWSRFRPIVLIPLALAALVSLSLPRPGGAAPHNIGNDCYSCHNIRSGQVWRGSYSVWVNKPIGMSSYGRPITCEVCHTNYGTGRFTASSASHHPVQVISGTSMATDNWTTTLIQCKDCHNADSVTSLTPNLTPDLAPTNYLGIAGNTPLDGYPNHDVTSPDNQVNFGDPAHLLAMRLSAGQRTLSGSGTYTRLPSSAPATDYGFCFSCHDGSNNTSRGATDNILASYVTKGHYFKSAAPTGGAINDRIPCSDCHASHNSVTNARLFEPDNTTWTGTRPTGLTMANEASPTAAETRAICIFCHEDYSAGDTTTTPKRVRNVQPIRRTYAVAEHALARTESCNLCHNTHNPPAGGDVCLDCHRTGGGVQARHQMTDLEFPADGTPGEDNAAVQVSGHKGVVYTTPFNTKALNECKKCHGTAHPTDAAKVQAADGASTWPTGFVYGLSWNGSTWSANAASFADTNTNNIIDGNEFCMSCHDGVDALSPVDNANIRIGGVNPPVVWFPSGGQSTGHDRKVGSNYPVSGNAPAQQLCTSCHKYHTSDRQQLFPGNLGPFGAGAGYTYAMPTWAGIGTNWQAPRPATPSFPSNAGRVVVGNVNANALNFTDRSSPVSGKGFGTAGAVGGTDGLCNACHRDAATVTAGTLNTAHTHEGNGVAPSSNVFVKDCVECHNPHGGGSTPNISMIRQTVGRDNTTQNAVVFTARTGANSFDENDGAVESNLDDLCATCHNNPAIGHNYRLEGTAGNHNQGTTCTSCHPHGQTDNAAKFGFPQAACNTCHGASSDSAGMPAAGDNGVYHTDANPVIGTRGADNTAHKIHVNYLNVKRGVTGVSACYVCHKGGGGQETHPGNPTNVNFKSGAQPTAVPYVQVLIDNTWRLDNNLGSATYSGTPGAAADNTNGWKTCSNTNCHYALSPSWAGKYQIQPGTMTVDNTLAGPAAGNLAAGSVNNVVDKIRLQTNATGMVTDNQFKVRLVAPTTAQNGTDIAKVTFWEDVDNDNTVSAGDVQIGGSAVFSGTDNGYTVGPVAYTVPASTTKQILVAVDLAATAVNGRTMTFSTVNGDIKASYGTITAWTTFSSSTFTVSARGTLTVSTPDALPAAGLFVKGSGANVLDKIRLVASGGFANVTGLKVKELGTALDNTDITYITFWHDADNDNTVDAGDTILGGPATFSAADNTYSVSGLSIDVPSGTTENILVVADVAPGGTVGRTIQTQMVDNTYVTLSAGTVAGTFPIAASSVQTISDGGLLTVTTPDALPAAGNLSSGSAGNYIDKITLTAATLGVVVSDLWVKKLGTAADNSDIASISFVDNTGGAMTPLGTGTFNAPDNTYRLTGLGLTVAVGTPRTILVAVNIANNATSGRTVQTQVNDGYVKASAGIVGAITSFSSTVQTIVVGALTVTTPDALPAAGNLSSGSDNVVIDKITLTAATGTVLVGDLWVKRLGTAVNTSDLALVSFVDNTGGAMTPLGAATYNSGDNTYRLTGLNLSVAVGTPRAILVMVNIADNATSGRTVQTQVNNGYVIALAGTVNAITSFSSTVQTIVVGSLTVTTPDALPAAGNIPFAANNNVIDKITLTAATGTVLVSNLWVKQLGTAVNSSDITAISFVDNTGGAMTDLGTATYNSGDNTYRLTGLSLAVAVGTPRTIVVMANTTLSATGGRTVQTQVNNGYVIALAGTVNAITSFSSTVQTIVTGTLTVTTPDALPAAGDIRAAYATNLIDKILLTATSAEVVVSGIWVKQLGNAVNGSDIASISFVDNTGGAMTPLGTGTFNAPDNTYRLTGLNLTVDVGAPWTILVMAGTATGATAGRTVQTQVNAGYVQATYGSVNAIISFSSTIQTIRALTGVIVTSTQGSITPVDNTVVGYGGTKQFYATATYSNAALNTDVTTSSSWTWSGTATGSTVGAGTGLYSAGSTTGTDNVRATYGGFSDNTIVNVMNLTAFPPTTYYVNINSGTALGWGSTNMTSGAGKTTQNDNTVLLKTETTITSTYYGATATGLRNAYNAIWNTAIPAGNNLLITGADFYIQIRKANAADQIQLLLVYFNATTGAATTIYDSGLFVPAGTVGTTGAVTHTSPPISVSVPSGTKLGLKVNFSQGSTTAMRIHAANGTAGQTTSVTLSGMNSTGTAPAPPRYTGGTTSIACNSCHQFGPDDATAGSKDGGQYYYAYSGSHAKHDVSLIKGSNPSAADAGPCVPCHGSGVTSYTLDHMTGTINLANGSIGAGGTGTGSYTPGGGGHNGTCSNVNCHRNVTTPAWGTGTLAGGCFACHTGTEVANKPLQPSDGVPNPVDNTQYKTMGHGNSATFSWDSVNGPAFLDNNTGAPNKGCFECHSSGADHVPKVVTDPYRLGAWATNLDGLCNDCHGPAAANPKKATNALNLGIKSHNRMNTASNYAWPAYYDYKCVDCHDPHGDNNYYMVRSAVNNPTGPTDTSPGSNGYGTPKDNTLTAVSFTSVSGFGANSYAISGAADGVCETCHNQTAVYNNAGADNAGTHAGKTGRCTTCHPHDFGFRVYGHDASGTADCKACHDVKVRATRPIRPEFDNTAQHAGVWTAITSADCQLCHLETSHDDNVVLKQWTGAATYNNVTYGGATPYTTNVFCLSCHKGDAWAKSFSVGGAPRNVGQYWGITAGTTALSHNYAPATYNTLPQVTKARSPHAFPGTNKLKQEAWQTSPPNQTKYTDAAPVACLECHPAHGSGIVSPTKLKGANFADNMTGGKMIVEAEPALCWTCHDTATPGVKDYWGESTTAGQHWTGTRSTPFAYKQKPYVSIHQVNDNASAPVACSICHNPHGASNWTTPIAYWAPMLRGTWMTSPYKEDRTGRLINASNLSADPQMAQLTASRYGPRAESSFIYNNPARRGHGFDNGTGTGHDGYFIDENTFGTTGTMDGTWSDTLITSNHISEPDTSFSGLCATCHTDATYSGSGAMKSWLTTGITALGRGKTGWGAAIHNTVKGWAGSGTTMDTVNPTNNTDMRGYSWAGTDTCMAYDTGCSSGWAPWRGYNWMGIASTTNQMAAASTAVHQFPCSKCHTAHASDLPKLMVTNCLDVGPSNTQRKAHGTEAAWAYPTIGGPAIGASNGAVAMICHGRGSASGTIQGRANNATDNGWNKVTGW